MVKDWSLIKEWQRLIKFSGQFLIALHRQDSSDQPVGSRISASIRPHRTICLWPVGVSLCPHPLLDSPWPFNLAQICCQCAQVWVSLLETISTSGDQTNNLTFNSSWRSLDMDSVVMNSLTFFCTWSATPRLSSIAPPLTCVGKLWFTSGTYYPLIQTKWLTSDYTTHCAGLKNKGSSSGTKLTSTCSQCNACTSWTCFQSMSLYRLCMVRVSLSFFTTQFKWFLRPNAPSAQSSRSIAVAAVLMISLSSQMSVHWHSCLMLYCCTLSKMIWKRGSHLEIPSATCSLSCCRLESVNKFKRSHVVKLDTQKPKLLKMCFWSTWAFIANSQSPRWSAR